MTFSCKVFKFWFDVAPSLAFRKAGFATATVPAKH